jgi:hypothetical protein
MTTKMYLAFQWTDEREAKEIIGVFSSAAKAQAACQLDTDANRANYFKGDPEAEPVPLEWETDGPDDLHADPGFGGEDRVYEIEEHELNIYKTGEYDRALGRVVWEKILL